MGEAKRRKQTDPYYGRFPKYGKGIVISNPIEIDGRKISIKSSDIDPIELRRSVLFWDRAVWPENNGIRFGSSIEADFLQTVGFLERPKFVINGDVASGVADSFTKAFLDNDTREPGQWALSTGENALLLRSRDFADGRGASVELFRAVPIPEHDVPLEEVLRFKKKRADEIRGFVLAIDEFYSNWVSAEDKEYQLNLAKRKIEQACMDIVRVAKEDRNSFRLANWKASFGVNVIGILGAAEFGAKIGQSFGFENLGRLVGGATSTLTLAKDIGFKNEGSASAPFRFAASLQLDTI